MNNQTLQSSIVDLSYDAVSSNCVAGTYDGSVWLYDLSTGDRYRFNSPHKARVSSVTVEPGGRHAASISDDGVACLWDVKKRAVKIKYSIGKDQGWRNVKGWYRTCHKAVISADSRTVFAVYSEHGNKPSEEEIIIFRDGKRLFQKKLLSEKILKMDISSCGRYAVSGDKKWYDILGAAGSAQNYNQLLCLLPQEMFIPNEEDCAVRIWDLVLGRQLHMFREHTGDINTVSISKNGLWAVSGSRDKTIVVYDLQKGRKAAHLDGHEGSVTSVGISECGRHVVYSSKDGPLRCWDTRRGQHSLFMVNDSITCCTIDSQNIVAGTSKGLIRAFNTSD